MKHSNKYLAGAAFFVVAVLGWLYFNGWPEPGDGGTGKRSTLARMMGVWLLAAWCAMYGLFLRIKGE